MAGVGNRLIKKENKIKQRDVDCLVQTHEVEFALETGKVLRNTSSYLTAAVLLSRGFPPKASLSVR